MHPLNDHLSRRGGCDTVRSLIQPPTRAYLQYQSTRGGMLGRIKSQESGHTLNHELVSL